MPTASERVCRFSDGREIPISGLQDADSCRFQGGQIVDAGAPQQRVSGSALRAQLSTARWRESVGESRLQVRDFGAILLSFPLCEIQRRIPEARLVRLLDQIDSEFAAEIEHMIDDDDDLREAVYRFVLATSSSVAVALANDSAEPGESFPVSELVDEGLGVARKIASRTANGDLAEAIREAGELAEALRGTPLAELVRALTQQQGPSPKTATF